ncbi:MAG: Mrp/NBP35 family ATP-binding protein [Actinomycetota bacterium]
MSSVTPTPYGRSPVVSVTQEAVIEALRPVQDPELHRSIVDLGMVSRVDINGETVVVAVDLTIPGCPLKAEINTAVTTAVTALDGVDRASVEFGVMTDEQRENIRRQIHGDPGATAGSQQAHGHAEGRAIPFADPDNRTRVILVASGKGGVGKSSVTTNLAVALAARDHSSGRKNKVAVVDADVWGFSVPRMLGVERDPVVIDEMIVPPEANGVNCISMGFFVEENQPVIWRGPMLHKALEQFLTDVYWNDPDFLVVDLPPGTGDIALSLAQFLPRSELLVVTTPQPAAQKVAQRAAYMAHKVRITVSGVIENMSWFTGDDGKRYELFGAGGGQVLAEELEVPLLAQIPLVPALREGADDGNPIAARPETEAGAAFADLAERVDVELAPTKRYRSELKIM